MTRERAVELLKGFQLCCDFDDCTNAWDCEECEEALNMAIDALEQEPVKHGEWINIFDNTWECTNCETCEQFAYNIESTSDYCPNCGARMERDGE